MSDGGAPPPDFLEGGESLPQRWALEWPAVVWEGVGEGSLGAEEEETTAREAARGLGGSRRVLGGGRCGAGGGGGAGRNHVFNVSG